MPLDHIEFVMFDMAGTTVDDRLVGSSLVVTAFVGAFAKAGLAIAPEQVHQHRGKEKREAIGSLLRELGQVDSPELNEQAAAIFSDFVDKLRAGVDSLREIRGTPEVFRFLKGRGIRVGVGSGFPQEVVNAIVDKFGWEAAGLVDYVGCAEEVRASRPDPKMIVHAMAKLGIADPQCVLKVGDTVVDILEGKNAGTWTVGVLSGSQSEEQLRTAGADYVLLTIALLPQLFAE